MTSDTSYTTEEIAKLLKISKLTVYDLIKKGELPSYRVGKQIRVDASDIEAYKLRARGIQATSPMQQQQLQQERAAATPMLQHLHGAGAGAVSTERPLVITGHDISLDILSKHIEKQQPGVRPLRSFVGSMDSLISMYKGESDIVSTHLLDGDSNTYNLPYIKRLLVGLPIAVVHLLTRSAGFYVRQGNPKQLHGWDDLRQPGLKLVNREQGSGARVLLDEQLRLHGITAGSLLGYVDVEHSHLAVAGRIAAGEADVGIGFQKAANIVGGIDFIPLIAERYDLVMLKRPDNMKWIETVLHIIQSDAFKNELRTIQGYDLSDTGSILLDT
ncbi:putative molybdopterin biosynthesis protein [Paenibacillus taihuensis]|uniref:Putative molybdopterin biosynthesis protein n=1 Tax=Paenibacillus taihuensis TaxID=1156355 RepID=A0A3D9S1P6_9BACL|nr:helix-turn-helix transcriptional regulator [Paenibacillus taihuensis]REE86527.1 putative molybdopterin biosynthesis protein [Paenibacillus taihuensis]